MKAFAIQLAPSNTRIFCACSGASLQGAYMRTRTATCMWRRLRDCRKQQGTRRQQMRQTQRQPQTPTSMWVQMQQRVRDSRYRRQLGPSMEQQRQLSGSSAAGAWSATLQHCGTGSKGSQPAVAGIGRRRSSRRCVNGGGSCGDGTSSSSSTSSDAGCCRRGSRKRQTQRAGTGRCGSVRCGMRSPGDSGTAPGQPGAPTCCPGG